VLDAIGGQVWSAAAVIPTPRVSMVDAAVKKSVVVPAIKRY